MIAVDFGEPEKEAARDRAEMAPLSEQSPVRDRRKARDEIQTKPKFRRSTKIHGTGDASSALYILVTVPFLPHETRTDTRHQAQDTRRMSSATLARARDMSPSGAETTCHARLEDQPAVHVDGRPTKWECDDHEATKRRGVLVRDVRTSPAHARVTATRGGDVMTSRQAQVASLSAHLQVRPRNARAFSSCSANAWRHGPKRASLEFRDRS